jgi:hypothetical protein
VQGFVDVISLPRDANDWPAEGVITEFEILQHRSSRQIQLWPLDPRYHHDDLDRETEWQRTKLRHPVGSVAPAEVIGVFPVNHEYVIRFRDDGSPPWSSVLAWTGAPPRTGSIARYRITAHLDTTRRIMVTPHGTPGGPRH